MLTMHHYLSFKCIFYKHIYHMSERKFLVNQIPLSFLVASSHSVSKPKQNCLQTNCSKSKTSHETTKFKYVPHGPSNTEYFDKNNSCTIQVTSQRQHLGTNSSMPRHSETIVNKYSPVPSLPRSPLDKLSFTIPEEPSREEVPSPIQRFFLGRFSKYLEKFQQSLANEMPDTFHMFNTFMNGFKEFVSDFRYYIAVVVKLSLPFHDLEDLSRKELQLYYNMPRQMIRVFPVVAISSLPFAQNFVLPIAYLFPKHLLCYQFWDAKQRKEFTVLQLRKRLFNSRPVFRCLQTRIDEVEDPVLMRKCLSIFFSLGSGVHPTLSQILEVKPLFIGEPFQINLLFPQHVNGLLRLHNRSVLFRRRKRLNEHARYIHCLDKALQKEGIDTLDSEQLWSMLLLRGINPMGMSNGEMRNYLKDWLQISKEIDERAFSLLLHLPIFLAYNYPMNLHLVYS